MATDWKIEHVLVTGATGFIGAHIIDELLARGIHVRAAARSHSKAEQMLRDRPQYKDQLEFTFINNLTDPNVFDAAAKGVDAIIHTASPAGEGFDAPDLEAAVILPAIAGTTSVLEAAKKEPRIKRIVLTSSFSAVIDPALGQAPGRTYTAADWSPVARDAWRSDGSAMSAYRASKRYAERAAWDCVRDEHPHFDLVVLCPPMVFGPAAHPVARIADLNVSSADLWRYGTRRAPVPGAYTQCWVDVRDLACAHVEALLRPEVRNRRYLVVAPTQYTYELAIDIVRKEFPWASGEGEVEQKEPECFFGDSETVAKDLGIRYRAFKDTVVEAIGQFREIQLRETGAAS